MELASQFSLAVEPPFGPDENQKTEEIVSLRRLRKREPAASSKDFAESKASKSSECRAVDLPSREAPGQLLMWYETLVVGRERGRAQRQWGLSCAAVSFSEAVRSSAGGRTQRLL